jgi:hypothetical protein
MQKIAALAVVMAVLVWPAILMAHHSLAQFDKETAVWVKGTVTRFERVNPHSLVFIEQKNADGQTLHWAVDGPGPLQLARMGVPTDYLKAGDVIEVCGSVMKEEFERARQTSNSAPVGSARPIIGHLLVMPDGKRRAWSGYGVLDKCLKPGEDQASVLPPF